MKNLLLFIFLFSTLSVFVACDDDDDGHSDASPDYHAHIHMPNADTKNVGDVVHIHTEFESQAGEMIHHVKVRIYEKGNEVNEVYNAPEDAHVMSAEAYEHHDDFTLTEEMMHKDFILEAKVWGHEAGSHEVVQMVEFHVHQP